jgi:hypothetical protein
MASMLTRYVSSKGVWTPCSTLMRYLNQWGDILTFAGIILF